MRATLDDSGEASKDEVLDDPTREVIRSLDELVRHSEHLDGRRLCRSGVELSSYVFCGAKGGGDPIRFGIFAGIHGDEPGGVHACVEFLRGLDRSPELATGYELHLYPVCNPTGFSAGTRMSRSGKDLNREFWRQSAEREVQLLEEEIHRHRFLGLISLHADDTSDGLYGFVGGAVLARALLEPALRAAERVLSRNEARIIDGFSAENGIISQCYDGILQSPPDLEPRPFEIILETPQRAAVEKQAEALHRALRSILAEYRKFLAFAADL